METIKQTVLTYDHPLDTSNNILPLTLSLTDTNSSWVELSAIPAELLEYSVEHFDELFEHHPKEKHNIISKDTGDDCKVFRWQRSYLNTPDYDSSDEYFKTHYFIYSGLDTSKNNDELPNMFVPFYEHIKRQDNRYNQVVINWYDSDDYIAFHRDCQRKLLKDVPIIVLTLTEEPCREFEIIPYEDNSDMIKSNFDNVKIIAKNGLLLKMCGEFQTEFRHGVKQNKNAGRRISISFRAFE